MSDPTVFTDGCNPNFPVVGLASVGGAICDSDAAGGVVSKRTGDEFADPSCRHPERPIKAAVVNIRWQVTLAIRIPRYSCWTIGAQPTRQMEP